MLHTTLTFLGRSRLAISLCCLGVASLANAGSINYGDFSDIPPGAVIYRDVTESSFSVAIPPNSLYGVPTALGNTLNFNNTTGFGVSSSGGASGLVDGQVNFMIEALPGAGLTSFSIAEGGDFSFSGVLPTPGTFVAASAGATVTILAVDGVDLVTPINVFATGTFVRDYPTQGGAPVTGLQQWSLVTGVDLGPSIPFPFVSGASKISVAIDNQLITGTTVGNTAAIAKKRFSVIPVGDLTPNEVVPEPGTLSMAALACIGLLAASRRRA